jgi:hypothetical protein
MTADDFKDLAWLEPWEAFVSESQRLTFEAELRRELGQRHPLFAARHVLQALAHRGDCDDALFLVGGEPPRLAVVHLTFRGVPELNPAWPSTRLYDTLAAWVEGCMRPDHEEWA